MICPRCGRERDRATAAFCPRCGFDFRTQWAKQDRRSRRGPIGVVLHALWRTFYLVSFLFVIGWCWRKGILGRAVALPLSGIWLLLALGLIAAAIGPDQKLLSSSEGAVTMGKVYPTTQPKSRKKVVATHTQSTAHPRPASVPHRHSTPLVVNTNYLDRQTGMRLTVREALIDPKGDSFTRPENGKEFEVLYVIVRNGSTRPNPSDLFDFDAVDQSGQTFGADIVLPMRYTELPSTDIPAGEQRAGWIGFQIPVTTRTVTLTWADNFHLYPNAEVAKFGIRHTRPNR